jgi:predicted secreted protein
VVGAVACGRRLSGERGDRRGREDDAGNRQAGRAGLVAGGASTADFGAMGDLPERVTVRVGESTTLRLPSLAGAGYRWEARVDDETVVTAEASFDDAVTTTKGTSFSETELLTLLGRRVGSTRVRCMQRRSWEGEADALTDASMTVDVVAGDRGGQTEKGGNA